MSDADVSNADVSNAAATIVPMQLHHIDLLLPYEQTMFGAEAWTRAGYRSELADHRHRTYVAAEDAAGALLGWAGVRVLSDEAEILTVGVVPEARGRSIARRMIAALLDAVRGAGATEVYLEVRVDNVEARGLYESEGFIDIGRRRGYYDHGRVDAIVMHRSLGS
jgi:ribosomal-protein-alanine N-acetyltransferase